MKRPTPTHRPLSRWVGLFFQYAMDKKKNFYWAWDQFLVVVRRQKKTTLLVLEVPLPTAPYLAQKHVDITHLPPEAVVASLLFLYNHYPSSFLLRRNREHSVRFLSFRSFLEKLLSQDISPPKTRPCGRSVDQSLVAYLVSTLSQYRIPFSLEQQPPQQAAYSLPQLLAPASI